MAFIVVEVRGEAEVVPEEGEAGAGRLVLVGDQVPAGEARPGWRRRCWSGAVFLNGTWPEIHDEVPM